MFVVIEGGDAVGKNTLVNELVRCASNSVRFPKGARKFNFPQYATPLGAEILQWLHNGGAQKYPLAFQSMMTVDRYSVATEIQKLAQTPGILCVADRWWQSGVVYSEAFKIDRWFLNQVHEALPQAELNFLLDAPANVASARRPEKRDTYERNAELMTTVSQGYRNLWDSHHQSRHWCVVDATASPDDVFDQVYTQILERSLELEALNGAECRSRQER